VDGRYCLWAVEPDTSGEILVKPVRGQRLPDLSYHLGFSLWPDLWFRDSSGPCSAAG